MDAKFAAFNQWHECYIWLILVLGPRGSISRIHSLLCFSFFCFFLGYVDGGATFTRLLVS